MVRGIPGLAYAAVPGAWLILPTYNEAENIEAIVGAALEHLGSVAAASIGS